MARNYSNWLKAYMEWTSLSESPDQFHFWTGVGTIAGALRSCVWIDQRIFKYLPNFFLFFVAPAGIATKSTSIRLGTRLLEQVPDIKFGSNSLTWQYLLRELQNAIITIKWEEGGVTHTRPASCLTIEASELGSFLKLEQDGLAEMLIELWDGNISSKRNFSHGTLSSGAIQVKNPWIHIMGATTPTWLTEHFPASMIGGGLTSRILFIYGDNKRQLVAYPGYVKLAYNYAETERKLIEDLTEISKLRGPYRLTKDAIQFGEDWYQDLWTTKPVHMASARYEGYRARKQAMLHKIAMVLAAAQSDDLVIDAMTLIEADAHLTNAEADMIKVFDSIGVVDEAKHLQEIVAIVRAYTTQYPHGMPSNDIYQLVSNIMSVKTFSEALIAAVKGSYLLLAQNKVQAKTGEMQQAVIIPPTSTKPRKI